jgi:uncharacterized membrane protein
MTYDVFSLKLADAAALAFFIGLWVLFSFAAAGRFSARVTLTQAMNR